MGRGTSPERLAVYYAKMWKKRMEERWGNKLYLFSFIDCQYPEEAFYVLRAFKMVKCDGAVVLGVDGICGVCRDAGWAVLRRVPIWSYDDLLIVDEAIGIYGKFYRTLRSLMPTDHARCLAAMIMDLESRFEAVYVTRKRRRK